MHRFQQSKRNSDRVNGFTLIEMLVTLAVAAIVLSMAIPAFGTLVRGNRVVTATNEFVASIHYARSEAVRRGVRVTLCPGSPEKGCQAGSDFADGWLAVAGDSPFSGGQVLRAFGPIPDSIALQIRFGALSPEHLSFLPTGQARRLGGGMLLGSVRLCDPPHDRRIIVSASGRPRLSKESCDN